MRIGILLITFLIPSIYWGQVTFGKTKHDFGEISNISDRFIDINLSNKGGKKEYILSVKKPSNVVYLVNGQFLEPDSSLTVRLQVNPTVKGRFNYEVKIFTSDKEEPTLIKLTGSLNSTSNKINPFQACPDFNSTPSKRNSVSSFELTVVTIDKETRNLIENTSVSMLQNGSPEWTLTTNINGEIKQKSNLGFSYFYANHPLYYPNEVGGYINFQRNYVVIELQRKPIKKIEPSITPEPTVATEATEAANNTDEKEALEQLEDELQKEFIAQEDSITIVPTQFNQLDKNDFNEQNFKPINVTFVLDISASMRAGEKMELMKFSLLQLSEMLRPQDKLTIVTYASESRVLLPTINGDEKDKAKEAIKGLRAGGMTAGGAGIKMGYKQTVRSFISDGTNQIIIITDGDFNRNSGDYKKYIKKYKKRGINMSVVGILNSEKDKKAMNEVAELGGGRYIPIFKLVDAKNNLKQEIRFICFRNKNY